MWVVGDDTVARTIGCWSFNCTGAWCGARFGYLLGTDAVCRKADNIYIYIFIYIYIVVAELTAVMLMVIGRSNIIVSLHLFEGYELHVDCRTYYKSALGVVLLQIEASLLNHLHLVPIYLLVAWEEIFYDSKWFSGWEKRGKMMKNFLVSHESLVNFRDE